MNPKPHQINRIFKLIILFIGLFLIFFTWWTNKIFGQVYIDQLLFTIKMGFRGALASDHYYVKSFIIWCLLFPAFITVFLILLDLKFIRLLGQRYLVLLIGLLYFGYQFSAVSFVNQFFGHHHDYFKKNYVDTTRISFAAHQPKSLVLIYVESLEDTYSDKNIFGRDLLRSLNELKKEGTSFNYYLQMPGTHWTIAALVSTQCAAPLKLVTIFGNNVQGEVLNDFLPKAKCLSDILVEKGYKNIYMNGASVRSCGIDKFLQQHHYNEMYGKEEWLARGIKEEEMRGWGLHDDDLFAQAKIKLSELITKNELFNLTIVTIDTHGPSGYLNKTCHKQGYNSFDGIVECAANQVADFVKFARSQGWLEKMNIVILGDHRAMSNPLTAKLESASRRYLFNLIISQQKLSKGTDYVVPFDMLPTILDLTGFQYRGGRLGLGYSALEPIRSIPPFDRIPVMDKQIGNYSATYNKLW